MTWKLESIPWPLEQLTRQYLGFNESVIKQYHDIIDYRGGRYLMDKRSETKWVIAQWRQSRLDVEITPYIYQFSFIFNKDYNPNKRYPWLHERISEPRCFYRDIVKLGVPVGRVI